MSLVKNSIYNLCFKGFNVVYPMVTSAYISRIFLADGVGRIMFVINIVTYFSIAASLGLPNYAVKVISGCRDNMEKLNKRFTELSLILAISSIIVSGIYYLSLPYIYRTDTTLLSLALVLGLIIVTNICNYDWLFESLEKFKYLAIRSITVKCILLGVMFLFVKDKSDIFIYCCIYAGITVLNNLWNLLSFKKYANYTKVGLNISTHIKPIVILFAAAFATEIYTLLDSTMLGIMCPPENLGYYSNASKVVRSLYGVIFAAIAVFNPRLSYFYGTKNYVSYKGLFQQYYNISIILAVPSALFLFFASKSITILLFGDDFGPASITLKILSILVIVFTLATVFGHFALIIYGKEKLLLIGAIAGAVVNFSLNQVLIPIFHHNGAALASVASEILVTGLLIFFSIRCFRIRILNKNLLHVILASAISSAVVYITNIESMLTNFWTIVAIGIMVVIVFSSVLIVLKNQTVMMLLSKLKHKFEV